MRAECTIVFAVTTASMVDEHTEMVSTDSASKNMDAGKDTGLTNDALFNGGETNPNLTTSKIAKTSATVGTGDAEAMGCKVIFVHSFVFHQPCVATNLEFMVGLGTCRW